MSDEARHEQSVLENAWSRFTVYDHNANQVQRQFFRLRLAMLVVGVAATVLAIFYSEIIWPSEVDSTGALVSDSRPHYTDWEFYVWLLMVAMPIAGSVLAAGASKVARGVDWISLRGAAEAIKREIYRYRCGVGGYGPGDDGSVSRDEKLAAAVGQATARLMDTEIINASLAGYAEQQIPPKYGVCEQDDGLSNLSAAQYLDWRLADQLLYFRGKSQKLDRRHQLFRWWIAILGGLGTLLAAMGQEIWVPAAVGIATALVSYLELRNIETKLAGYNRAALELDNVETWWSGLPADGKSDAANFALLIDRTETILGSENATWVQEMQKVMARAEDDEVES